MLSADYGQEQNDLREKLLQLNEDITQQEEQAENIDSFIRKIKKYPDLDEMTPAVLSDMVKAVTSTRQINQAESGNSRQIFPMTLWGCSPPPCSATCKRSKRHSRSYTVSRKRSYPVL